MRVKFGWLMIIIGILLISLFVNNTVIYANTLETRMAYLEEQAEKLKLEPETVELLEISYRVYSPSDWVSNLIISAPSENEILSKAIVFDNLLKVEKTLAEVIAGHQEKLSELEARVDKAEKGLVILSTEIGRLYRSMWQLAEAVLIVNQRTNELAGSVGKLADRVARLEDASKNYLSKTSNPVVKAVDDVGKTINNLWCMLTGQWWNIRF